SVLCYLAAFTAPPVPYQYDTLSLHDALPISVPVSGTSSPASTPSTVDLPEPLGPSSASVPPGGTARSTSSVKPPRRSRTSAARPDRKSTRLNSSHVKKSYAVFCLKKKKNIL